MCEWSTVDIENKSGWLTVHINKKHNLTIETFINKFPEFKEKWKMYFIRKDREDFINSDSKNRIECLECNKFFKKLSNSHLIKHNITPAEYKKKYNISNTSSQNTSELQSEITTKYNLLYGSAFKNKGSSYEDDLAKKLDKCNIQYIHQFLYMGRRFDFYLPKLDIIIELDGEGHHLDRLENMSIQTINGSINDFKKNAIMKSQEKMFKFFRIRYDKNNFSFNSIESFLEKINKYKYDAVYDMVYEQKVIQKTYFEKFLKYKGEDKLKKYVSLLLKFIKTFHPQFPYLEQKENLQDIMNVISNYDLTRIYDNKNNIFKNNTYCIGINYLKSNFKSYWHSRFKKNVSPIEAWDDDELMKKIIEYRIGLNNSGEIFDFSLHQLIRGMSARRITISFFKPLLAAAIYKYFLGNNKTPVVIDPCAGFGARLLGFKSIYPHGTYIGIEPNIETYNELKILAKNFSNVKLYNCKLEDYEDSRKCNLTFTSIPYFDTEIYSNNVEYSSIYEWKNTFIEELLTFDNLVVNIPSKLESLFEGVHRKHYLVSNTSHFNKLNVNKSELILQMKDITRV